jgi:organic hydroperoxide reductase OsmC/OhrA
VLKAKELHFEVALDGAGELHVEDGTPLALASGWTAEHLLLAGLVRCSLESLRYAASRARIEVTASSGSASAVVTRRESDGLYAVVSAEVALNISLAPKPTADALTRLLANAERGCFIGASLTAKPAYRWNVA